MILAALVVVVLVVVVGESRMEVVVRGSCASGLWWSLQSRWKVSGCADGPLAA